MLSSFHPFSEDDVERCYGSHETQKGRAYLNRVHSLVWDGNTITARVKGTANSPYQVNIQTYRSHSGSLGFDDECSCPLGGSCKHVTATLLKAIESQGETLETGVRETVRPQVMEWVSRLRAEYGTAGEVAKPPAQRLYYLLSDGSRPGDVEISFFKAKTGVDGHPTGMRQMWHNVERALVSPPSFVTPEDLPILRLLWLYRDNSYQWTPSYPLRGAEGEETLALLLASNRLFLARGALPLQRGADRPGQVSWPVGSDGRMQVNLDIQPTAQALLGLDHIWYLDGERSEVGRVAIPGKAPLINRLLALPALSAKEAPLVANALAEVAPELPGPVTPGEGLRVIDCDPVPCLDLQTVKTMGVRPHRGYVQCGELREFDFGVPAFRYENVEVAVDNPSDFHTLPGGEVVRLKRRAKVEATYLKTLQKWGFRRCPPNVAYTREPVPTHAYGLESEESWDDFMEALLPAMQTAGWEVHIPHAFRHSFLTVDAWEADLNEQDSGWFSLDMGIQVDGRRLPLAPLLSDLFERDPGWLDALRLAEIPDTNPVFLMTPTGERIRVSAGRIKPLARTLIDLFDHPSLGSLRISRFDAARLAELGSDTSRWQFKGFDAIQEMAARLAGSGGVTPIAPPEGFTLALRPYQQEGLAWLQYLREQNLSGILADDMGLGKTAQTLAHLLTEKQAGRLKQPALVVLPTSLIFNWRNEAARCAPDLTVLSLHGKERKARFPEIPKHDVILTTYPLLWRDEEELLRHDYHLLILDEAQTVKNPGSQGAAVVRRIKAKHRLCLTGTPLENHLGELWTQFDFLMPGFLGDSRSFSRSFRTPIEKHGDLLRQDLLARRLRPFILRRRKEDVATELPPKTQIIRTVELEGGQRDLYETVRAAQDEKVRMALADKGFARSQIVILDALLKLRQVCCDPRLLPSLGARKVKERAKLDLLMDMLPDLVQEGRRILVFSQFTTMLDLIRQELEKAHITYLLLTGETQDRETPIQRFQAGAVPVFLISLKAGGVGLNLTAADTVIHYDPWWNPAVENQATDRAHRLGQDKPVFVYKLIVAGSIEERILALQERKAELAEGILGADPTATAKFTPEDLQALLAPLPPIG